MSFYILFPLLFGTAADIFLCRRFKPPQYPFTVVLSAAAFTMLYFTFDDPLQVIKGFLFAQTLIIIGYSDAKTHQIPDMLLIPIFLAGLIQIHPVAALEGLFAVVIPLLLAEIISKGGIGGGDVKLMAATGFVLGPAGAVGGALIGFSLFLLVCILFYQRKKGKAYAMAPYLGVGCFIAYTLKL